METQEPVCKQCWDDNGQLCFEKYRLNGKLHNESGPAYRSWYPNGHLCFEEYRLNGKLHNESGPAYRSWYSDDQLCLEEYWINDKQLTKEEWQERVNGCSRAAGQ